GQRQDIGNGIRLCQHCAKLVDNGTMRYSVERLQQWKADAEKRTRTLVESPGKRGDHPRFAQSEHQHYRTLLSALRVELQLILNSLDYLNATLEKPEQFSPRPMRTVVLESLASKPDLLD